MFNLLVSYSGWAEGRDTIAAARVLEYTSEPLLERFRPNGKFDFDSMLRLPAVFLQETIAFAASPVARLGSVVRIGTAGKDVTLEYFYDPSLPALTNEDFEALASELGIDSFEFTRTHWAIKDADLFRALMRRVAPKRLRSRVFTLADPERIEPVLVSAMMPFHPSFDNVYATLQEAAVQAGLRCRRADDIWENPAVMQDVVSLIDRSKVVICDCSGRNPNVFYEIGIAHTLGREVILITQAEADIPFDLRHLRFITYLNNGEGRDELKKRVGSRLADLAGS